MTQQATKLKPGMQRTPIADRAPKNELRQRRKRARNRKPQTNPYDQHHCAPCGIVRILLLCAILWVSIVGYLST